jgi:hypothetical protein
MYAKSTLMYSTYASINLVKDVRGQFRITFFESTQKSIPDYNIVLYT